MSCCNNDKEIPINSKEMNIVEVIFKAGRIGIYANKSNLDIKTERYVIVESEKGKDIGKVTLMGKAYIGNENEEELKNVIRLATQSDLEKLEKNRELDELATRVCKEKIAKHRLNMNLVDTEYQWDKKKLTFYFTSEERVDFRKLVRDLASKYRTRIELRQIGVRDAAKHIYGYGNCGCPLCCTVFLRKFENITTQYIKDQLIPTNPSRLTGVCGRLKCCLAFERDFYIEELNKYPTVGKTVSTPNGLGIIEKIDIFNAKIYIRFKSGDIERFDSRVVQLAVATEDAT